MERYVQNNERARSLSIEPFCFVIEGIGLHVQNGHYFYKLLHYTIQ